MQPRFEKQKNVEESIGSNAKQPIHRDLLFHAVAFFKLPRTQIGTKSAGKFSFSETSRRRPQRSSSGSSYPELFVFLLFLLERFSARSGAGGRNRAAEEAATPTPPSRRPYRNRRRFRTKDFER